MFIQLSNLFARIPHPTRRIAVIILIQKTVFTLLLFLAPVLVPSLYPFGESGKGRFTVLDTHYYLDIAAHGYSAKGLECAFYPLWPLCIRLGSLLSGGNMIVAGFVLANLFSSVALLLFHGFVWKKHGLPLANRSTVLLLLFPGSIFFFFPYSESLFLLLLVLFLRSLQTTYYRVAGIAAFFLPLTRAIGIFILPVLVWELLRQKQLGKHYRLCAAPMLGYLAYFGVMYFYTQNPFEGFDAQQRYPAKASISRIADPAGFVQSFLDFGWSHNPLNSPLDRGLFLFFLLSLWWVARMDSGYYVYSIFAGLVPALSNRLMSYTRFLSLVFPLFILMGTLTCRGWMFWIITAVFGGAQVYLFLRHTCAIWVG